jgi:pimeloyl-ACP methyl ester carboxylesterase
MLKLFILLQVVIIVFIATDGGFVPALKRETGSPADTMIEIDEVNLHFMISRGGETTVLLEAGGGADASQWTEIQKRLSIETAATVISYDRPGFGGSDLPGTPYDLVKEVKNLHECLARLGTKRIILVSHSYGAFLTLAYQSAFPQNVDGIILLDPNSVRFVDSVGASMLSRLPFDTSGSLTKLQKAEVRQATALERTMESVRAMTFAKEIPVTVVTAGVGWWPFARLNEWWRDSHKQIAQQVNSGTLVVAEGATHNIPAQKAELVVKLIKDQLNGVKR